MYHIMLLNMNDAESERMNKNEVKEQEKKKLQFELHGMHTMVLLSCLCFQSWYKNKEKYIELCFLY